MQNKRFKKKDLVSNKKAKAIADALSNMFVEIEKICHQIAVEIIPEEDVNKIFLRTELVKDQLMFGVQIYNYNTKTRVIKRNSISEMLVLAQANLIENLLRDDIQKMYEESIKKINDSDTEIMI